MSGLVHDCGAPLAKHPTSGYSDAGACLEALKAHKVMGPCDWPRCPKRVRKLYLGHNFCRPHREQEYGAFMGICQIEGPAGLSKHHPTLAEKVAFWKTGTLPKSRRYQPTFATSKVHCGTCGAGLVIVNDPDWSPDLPNAMSTRDDGTAWGIGICQCCSGPNCRHCLWHGEMVDGHQPDPLGRCQRCGRDCGLAAA